MSRSQRQDALDYERERGRQEQARKGLGFKFVCFWTLAPKPQNRPKPALCFGVVFSEFLKV